MRNYVAQVTIYDAKKLTKTSRRTLALWLVGVGKRLLKEGDYYHTVFHARYMGDLEHK